jgi:hydrogenase maturation factor
VLEESRVLRRYASFMHDPTEGGFYGGLGEICRLSGMSAQVSRDSVPVHRCTRAASKALGFDPLRLVASGSLMAVVPESRAAEAEDAFRGSEIMITRVGTLVSPSEPRPPDLPEATEELWALLKRSGAA